MSKYANSFTFLHWLRYTSLIILVWMKLGSSYIGVPNTRRGVDNTPNCKLNVAVSPLSPADLTPAIDKFARLPERDFYENFKSNSINPFWLSRKSPSPIGPDPFQLVNDELKSLSEYVKELVASENPVLTMAASHFFQQVKL